MSKTLSNPILIWLFFNLFSAANLTGQTATLQGKVIDQATKEAIPFASVAAPDRKTGTRTDWDGSFKIAWDGKPLLLKFSSLGYKNLEFTFTERKANLVVELEPDNVLLQTVTIKPKKYRNKNNPTVELIRRVIDNRKNNRVEGFQSYKEEQYEKILMGFTNVSDKLRNKKVFKSWKPMTDNIDTSLIEGVRATPAFLQESVQDFYSQRSPKRSKIWVKAQKKVKFDLLDAAGIDKYLRYLYQESDIYDDFVVLVSDHFVSPIADNAPLFYRYYPIDTVEAEGSKIVRLSFFPRNKTDMMLQGEMHIALDSTYPVTRIIYTVNPNINLNWVRQLEMDQQFRKMDNGKWVLSEENYILDFGVSKNGLGIFGKRYVSHQNPQMGAAISDTIFQKTFELRTLRAGAEVQDSIFWKNSRHAELSKTEAQVYVAMDSLQRTLLFKRIAKTTHLLIAGHWKPKALPGIEIGRINTFYSFNPVEGDRARFGFRTNPDFSKQFNFEGYIAYGFRDQRWKYGAAFNIALDKGRPFNQFPYNMLRVNYQQDLLTPGVLIIGTFAPSSLATSLVRGTNDRFLFQKKLVVQYEREFQNRFSYMVGFEHRDLSPLGSLTFTPTDDVLPNGGNVVAATPYLQLRYAPGEEFYQTRVGWRKRIRFKNILQARYSRGVKGIGGSQYNYDEVAATYYRFSNLPPIGYNYFYVEAGGVFGKVPYPLLTVHRANQTFGYRFLAYNLMNFMEFVSDRYVAVNMEHNFYGFFVNKIPLLRRLKLREYITCKVLYGQISEQNRPRPGSGLYELPTYSDGRPLTYSLEAKPYIEGSIGIGNIFKVVRLDLVRRFTYLDHPETAKFGVRIAAALQF